MSNISSPRKINLAAAALAVCALAAPARPQEPRMGTQPSPQPSAQQPSRSDAAKLPAAGAAQKAEPTWELRVSKAKPTTISLKAKNAPLTDVAAELGRKLKLPILLSPLMQKQRVTQEFSEMPLEGALTLLAPVPLVDYRIGGDAAGQPQPVGIYLYAFNEQPPARDAVVKGNEETFLIEGNTEEGTEAYEKAKETEDSPLRVKVERNLLSVRSRRQPLAVVLLEIASKVDIPFEMKYESSDLVDADFSNFTIEQAVRSLSPNIRLYQRTNLANYETIPLRLMLLPPTTQPNPKQ